MTAVLPKRRIKHLRGGCFRAAPRYYLSTSVLLTNVFSFTIWSVALAHTSVIVALLLCVVRRNI